MKFGREEDKRPNVDENIFADFFFFGGFYEIGVCVVLVFFFVVLKSGVFFVMDYTNGDLKVNYKYKYNIINNYICLRFIIIIIIN